jgi:hypothetical protein
LVRTTIIFLTSPLTTEPSFCIELATITAMYSGIAEGGFELLPGSLAHEPPHVGCSDPFSKPLNALGAGTPLIGLFLAHCEPQK